PNTRIADLRGDPIYEDTPSGVGFLGEEKFYKIVGYRNGSATVKLSVTCKFEQNALAKELAAAFGMTVPEYKEATRRTGLHQIDALAPRALSGELNIMGDTVGQFSFGDSRISGETIWIIKLPQLTSDQCMALCENNFQ